MATFDPADADFVFIKIHKHQDPTHTHEVLDGATGGPVPPTPWKTGQAPDQPPSTWLHQASWTYSSPV